MQPNARDIIVWQLIAILAIVAGAGETLHFFPGCGHGTWVGDTVVAFGISLPNGRPPSDGDPRVERPHGRGVPIYDEDECAICTVVGQAGTSSGSAQLVLVAPLVHSPSSIVLCDMPAAAVRLFQARAPPLV